MDRVERDGHLHSHALGAQPLTAVVCSTVYLKSIYIDIGCFFYYSFIPGVLGVHIQVAAWHDPIVRGAGV